MRSRCPCHDGTSRVVAFGGVVLMKVLVTGSEGLVGNAICEALQAAGHEFEGFDRARSQDILNIAPLEASARSCDAVVHCAALLGAGKAATR